MATLTQGQLSHVSFEKKNLMPLDTVEDTPPLLQLRDTHVFIDGLLLPLTHDIYSMFSAIRVRPVCAIDINPIVFIVLLIFSG